MAFPYGLCLHGGAGTILRHEMTPAVEAEIRADLGRALDTGLDLLRRGAPALDAVTATVVVLEEAPWFNAGRGAVLNLRGEPQLDAAVMDGKTKAAGACAAIQGVRNPVKLARAILEHSPHVLMVGPGAEDFARQQQLEFAPPEHFILPRRREQWQRLLSGEPVARLENAPELADGAPSTTATAPESKAGTVGAVALDLHGNLAAATSTGGLTGKLPGRVGDSPVIGAGTWADNATCAISCTGHGEHFIRAVTAYDVAALIEYCGLSLSEATARVVLGKLKARGAEGGLIAINRAGQFALTFNTPGMYRGFAFGDGRRGTGMYVDA